MSDQPVETSPAAVACRSVGRHQLEVLAEPADRRQKRARDRCRYRVEGLDRTVDGVRPGAQVSCPGRCPLVCGGVLAVVAGEVEVQEVNQRVPPVDLDHGECSARARLCRGQVCFVVRIRLGSTLPQRCEQGRYSRRREVLSPAVEFVQTRELAGLGHV